MAKLEMCLVLLLGLLWSAGGATAAESRGEPASSARRAPSREGMGTLSGFPYQRYVVVESPPLKLRAEEKAQVLFAVTGELRAAGCEVASEQEGARGGCTTPECWKATAAAAKATDVLVVAGEYASFHWTLSLEHRNASGARVDLQNKDCEYCRLPSILEWTHAAVRQTVETARTQAAAALRDAQPSTPPPTQPAPPLAVSTPAPRSFFWPPWAVVGAGAVVMGFGAWALYKNDQDAGSCAPTPAGQKACNRYDSTTYGVVGLAGGGALALGGILWAILAPSSPSVSVSLNHVAFSVRF